MITQTLAAERLAEAGFKVETINWDTRARREIDLMATRPSDGKTFVFASHGYMFNEDEIKIATEEHG